MRKRKRKISVGRGSETIGEYSVNYANEGPRDTHQWQCALTVSDE